MVRQLSLGPALMVLALAAVGCEASAPDDSGKPVANELTEQVISSDWAVRKLAQRSLHLQANSDNQRRLAEQLIDDVENAQNRREVARSVGMAYRLDPIAAVERARGLVKNPAISLVRRGNVLQALARHVAAPDAPAEFADTARELMRTAGNHNESKWGIGLRLLGRFAPGEAWPQVLASLDGDEEERRSAVAAMSEQRFEGSLPRLAALTSDPDRYVRRKALKALQGFPSAVSADAIDAVLASEQDGAVCSRAIEAAGQMVPHVAAELLLARLNAADGCGPRHRFAILSELRRVLHRQPQLARVRGALLGVMQRSPEPSEAAFAAAAVGDLQAAQALAEQGAVDGLVLLTSRSLEASDARLVAIGALGQVEHIKASHRLESLLASVDEDADTLLAVLAALDASGGLAPEKAFLLTPFTSDSEDPRLRTAAVERLAAGGDGYRVARRLAILLEDADTAIAGMVRQGLVRLKGDDLGAKTAAWQPFVEQLRLEEMAAKQDAEDDNTVKQSEVDLYPNAATQK